MAGDEGKKKQEEMSLLTQPYQYLDIQTQIQTDSVHPCTTFHGQVNKHCFSSATRECNLIEVRLG